MTDVYDSIVIGDEGEVPPGTKIAVKQTATGEDLQVLLVGDVLGNVATFTSDGKLEIAGGGTPATVVAPTDLGGGNWTWDCSAASIGEVFDLTAIPHQGSAVNGIVLAPAPTSRREFSFLWHVDKHSSPDATSFIVLIDAGLTLIPDGYPTQSFAASLAANGVAYASTSFSGSADAEVAVTSSGDGNYVLVKVDPSVTVPFAAYYRGTGLDGDTVGLSSATGHHEGILDRIRAVQAIAPPAFDPTPYIGAGNGPADWAAITWTGGHGVVTVHGDLAVLDRSDPTLPYLFHVETDRSLTAYNHPDVFNDPTTGPGNFYRLVLSKPSDPDDGMIAMWLANDPKMHQRGGSFEIPDTSGGRWLTYPAGTPL